MQLSTMAAKDCEKTMGCGSMCLTHRASSASSLELSFLAWKLTKWI